MKDFNIDILSIILSFTNEIMQILRLNTTFYSKLNTRFFHNNFKMKYTYIGTNNTTYLTKFISTLNMKKFDKQFLDSFNCISKIFFSSSVSLSDITKYFKIYKMEMFSHRVLLNDKIIIEEEIDDDKMDFFKDIKEFKIKNLLLYLTHKGLMKLTKLEKLHISTSAVQNIALDSIFFKYMPNLKYLHFRNVQTIPFEHILHLTKLEYLCIRECRVYKLDLSPFNNLTHLSLIFCNIMTDILFMKCINTLKKIIIYTTNESSISDEIFKNQVNLESIELFGCSFIKGKYFKYLTKLKKITLICFQDISFDCPISIEYLNCRQSENILIENLSSLTNLKLFNPSADYIITNETIQELQKLNSLHLSGNKLNISMFKYLRSSKLEVLDVRDCNKLNDNNLLHLINLKELTIINCKNISGIFLSKMEQLKKLRISYLKKIRLNEINKMKNITSLTINHCRNITDKEIKNLSQLKYLKVIDSFGKILTRQLLHNLKNIETLSITKSNNLFEDRISLPKLKTLKVDKCLFKDKYILCMPNLENLYMHSITFRGKYLPKLSLKYLTIYNTKMTGHFCMLIDSIPYLMSLRLYKINN